MLAVFLAVSSLVLLVFLLVDGRKSRVDTRLDELAGRADSPERDSVGQVARSALPRLGAPLMPRTEEERTRLQGRLIQAGLYGRQAMVIFLGVKMLLIVGPAVVGLFAGV